MVLIHLLMAASLHQQDSTVSFNSKLQKTSTNVDSEYDRSKKSFIDSKKIQEENHKTLKAFLSESLLYDPKSVCWFCSTYIIFIKLILK